MTTNDLNIIVTTPTADSTDADIAALHAHAEAIQEPHAAAFQEPAVHDYARGAIVWMWDHYNTAIVQGPGEVPDTWFVVTKGADGRPCTYRYVSTWLRPAVEPRVFTWRAD